MSTDYQNVQSVGVQVSADGNRLWVCVDGTCVLRVKGITELIGIQDDRNNIEKADEIERLQAKLRRVRDWIKFASNSFGGIVSEIDDILEVAEARKWKHEAAAAGGNDVDYT